MPLVKIETIKGKSSEYKKSLLDTIHDALVKSLGIEEWDRFQRIIEYDKDNFETPEGKTDDFMIIELTLFPGRSKTQKKAVIETITSDLNSNLGIASTDIFIVINEPPLENWGMAGKQLGGVGLGIFRGYSAVDIDHCVEFHCIMNSQYVKQSYKNPIYFCPICLCKLYIGLNLDLEKDLAGYDGL